MVADPTGACVREFEANSQDNGYLLEPDLAPLRGRRRGATVAAIDNMPDQIAALTADAIQLAAQTYLDTRRTT